MYRLSLYTNNMLIYLEKPKELTEKLVEVNRVARYKNMYHTEWFSYMLAITFNWYIGRNTST